MDRRPGSSMVAHLRMRVHGLDAGDDVRHGFLALASVVLTACATPVPLPVQPEGLFHDAAFQPRPVPADPAVFAVSASMRHYLDTEIARQLRQKGSLRGLLAALESDRQLKLDYDAAFTRTAAETFESRAGNCLSLTIMTAALARELGLSVSFQRIIAEPVWTRSDDILIANGHVNIVLQPSLARDPTVFDWVSGIIVDFEPGADIRRQRSREIGEQTVVAMYMNNRAAEAMIGGSLDDAYWWARGAVLHDPRFLDAFNTLGVVYSRHGDLAHAERVFQSVLAVEAENVTGMRNLAAVLEKQGKLGELLALSAKLRRIEPHPPFHFFDLGMAALKRRDFAAARDYFSRELDRNAFYHEAHFGLAVAYLGLGEIPSAQRHLGKALETSSNRREHDLYAAKLAWLRSRRPQ